MQRIGLGLLCLASATLMLELTLVRIFDVIWYSNKYIIKNIWKDTIINLMVNITLFSVLTFFGLRLGIKCDTYLEFILVTGIIAIVFIGIYLGINVLLKREKFRRLYRVMVNG